MSEFNKQNFSIEVSLRLVDQRFSFEYRQRNFSFMNSKMLKFTINELPTTTNDLPYNTTKRYQGEKDHGYARAINKKNIYLKIQLNIQ